MLQQVVEVFRSMPVRVAVLPGGMLAADGAAEDALVRRGFSVVKDALLVAIEAALGEEPRGGTGIETRFRQDGAVRHRAVYLVSLRRLVRPGPRDLSRR